jgi:hypothetical protein
VFWEEMKERCFKEKKPPEAEKSKDAKVKGKKNLGVAVAPKDMEVDNTIVEGEKEIMMVEVTWMQPYLAYLQNKELLDNQVKARRIALRSKAFRVVNDELYKRSITIVVQQCVTPVEGQAILKDMQEGICGHRASYRVITTKAFRGGFYWLTDVEVMHIKCIHELCPLSY